MSVTQTFSKYQETKQLVSPLIISHNNNKEKNTVGKWHNKNEHYIRDRVDQATYNLIISIFLKARQLCPSGSTSSGYTGKDNFIGCLLPIKSKERIKNRFTLQKPDEDWSRSISKAIIYIDSVDH